MAKDVKVKYWGACQQKFLDFQNARHTSEIFDNLNFLKFFEMSSKLKIEKRVSVGKEETFQKWNFFQKNAFR